MTESFGMMEGAFFVPRNDLLNWINDLLKINLTRVEQLGTGAVYCQIIDACFPGEVALQKVNWKAKHEYEFVNNYKVLQLAFSRLGIKKPIDVEKLSKAKCQDNLEFAQWIKRFFELKFGKDGKRDYNAVERRGNVTPEFTFTQKGTSPKIVLIQQNSEGCERSKGKKAEKRIKTSEDEYKPVKLNMEGLENSSPKIQNKLIQERDELAQKLTIIEEIVLSTKESDANILKKVRDFLGAMNQPDSSPYLDDSMSLLDRSDPMVDGQSTIGKSSSKQDTALLIDGESI